MADGYNDELTPEELALLASDEANAAVPPAEDDDRNPVSPAQVAAEQGLNPDGTPKEAAPAAAPSAAPVDPNAPATLAAAPAAPAPAQTDADRRAAFMAAHKDKTPEQLLDLAFQQEGRANRAGFTARQSKEQLDAIQQRAAAAIERVRSERAQLGTRREQFDQQLQDDPDAATRTVHEQMMTAEEQRLEREERAAQREAAVGMASSIPGFDLDTATAFGAEMNYSPEELAMVTDPRDLATLHLASVSGRLMKAGVIDFQGNFIQQPAVVAATDPRLTAPAPVSTLSSAPARGGNGGQTLEQQLTDITNMDDKQMEEFEKANPGLLESLLRKAG